MLRTLTTTVLLTAAGTLAFAAPAHAGNHDDCRTVTTHVTGRPDSGNHGTWATDAFTRSVEVCHTDGKAPEGSWAYHATLKDAGGFTTVAGAANSPQAGTQVHGGVHGDMIGGFTATFTAGAHWDGYDDSHLDGKTVNGAAAGTASSPTTSTWVSALWTSGFAGSPINDDWKWTYSTCCEKWVDAAGNSDGSLPADGDVTGKPCPEASASASHTAAPSPTVSRSTSPSKSAEAGSVGTPTVVPSAGAVGGPGAGGGGELAVTGTNVVAIVGAGLALLAAGGTAVWFFRRRRVSFVS